MRISGLKRVCVVGAVAAMVMAMPVISYADNQDVIKIESEEIGKSTLQETEVVILWDGPAESVGVSEKKADILRVPAEKDENPDFFEWLKGKLGVLVNGI